MWTMTKSNNRYLHNGKLSHHPHQVLALLKNTVFWFFQVFLLVYLSLKLESPRLQAWTMTQILGDLHASKTLELEVSWHLLWSVHWVQGSTSNPPYPIPPSHWFLETAAAIFIFTTYFVQPGQNNGQIFKYLKQIFFNLYWRSQKRSEKKLQRQREN